LIVVNPVSGKGHALRTARLVAEIMRGRGFDVTIHETENARDGESYARRRCESDDKPLAVVACGGDGTIQQVANAVAPLRANLGSGCPAVGLAPAGRCNDFARIFGISREPEDIAHTLMTGRRMPVDLGRVNGRYFCTVVTVGVDAEISSYVDQMKMPIRGTLAYIYGALRVLSRYRGRHLRVAGDFEPVDQRVFLASSANTSSYGGAIKIAPHAVPTDGMLDLCLIENISRWRSLTLLARVLAGKHVALPEVHFGKMKTLTMDSDEPIEMWADGERVATTPATITVMPNAIDVIVPESTAQNGMISGTWQ
jgi:YegS/Rv2252/BmrU family lipid kinase